SLRSGSWVAAPTGHIPVPQIRYCWQAMAIRGAEAMATASAPMAMAFAASADTRRPPVITRLISDPAASRYFLARCRSYTVGTLEASLRSFGEEPVAPPLP